MTADQEAELKMLCIKADMLGARGISPWIEWGARAIELRCGVVALAEVQEAINEHLEQLNARS